ncbi:unnamed protein product [Cuscuta epithymum]|uniref:Uncharacterized protein n=1 Tax=Cuscuta epithymum TaxID=186058 RepID=A0AAV0DVZ2_9ASTE|nr:unnamed protein product [Cuscuta epithymum]
MGACASKPKDLDTQEAPIPEAPLSPQKTDIHAAPEMQENKEDGEETKKEETLVDLTEPAQEAPKAEEAAVETETRKAEAVLGETTSTAAVVEKVSIEEDNKAKKVGDEDEKKKEEVVAVADEVVVASPAIAAVTEVKTETPVTA